MTLLERLSERELVRPALMMALVWGLAQAVAGFDPLFLPRSGGLWAVLAVRALVYLVVGALVALLAIRTRNRSALAFGALAAVVEIAFALLQAITSGARRAALSHALSMTALGLLLQSTLARAVTSVFFLLGLALVARFLPAKFGEEGTGRFGFLGLDRGAEARLAWWGAILLAVFDVAGLVGLFVPRSFSAASGAISTSQWVSWIVPAVLVAIVAYLGIRMWRAPRGAWVAFVGSELVIAAGQMLALTLVPHVSATAALSRIAIGVLLLVVLVAAGVAAAPPSRRVV